MLAEPHPTLYDLRFKIGPFPVRVHPLFWVICAIFGWAGDHVALTLIWVGAVFVSILVHELGHAVLMRRFGGRPRVWLYSFGGLAIDEAGRGRRTHQDVLISLAGPAAGFVLAALVVGVLFATGTSTGFFGYPVGGPRLLESLELRVLAADLLYVNIFWGLVNLLPVFPLDGGQTARALLVSRLGRHRGTVASLRLSIAAAALAAILGFVQLGSIYIAIMFGLLAASSHQALQSISGGPGGPSGGAGGFHDQRGRPGGW